MISRRMHRCETILVFALVCSAVWAGEPNDTPDRITFETSPTALGPFSASYATQGWRPFASKPAYAAAIVFGEPIEFLPVLKGRGLNPDFLRFAVREGDLSERQKEFLGEARVAFESWNGMLVHRPDPNGPDCLLLYGVTQEDARQMARAYGRYAVQSFQGRVASHARWVQEDLAKIEDARRRMTEVEELLEAIPKTIEELRKTVPYRTENEAQEAVGELDRIINTAQVEAAGLKARVQAVQTHLQEARARKTGPGLVERLEAMFVEESILWQGAEARRQMATQLREQANRFMDLKARLVGATTEKLHLPETLSRLQSNLANHQRSLESAQQNRPRIPDKVTIYPITWADDVPGK